MPIILNLNFNPNPKSNNPNSNLKPLTLTTNPSINFQEPNFISICHTWPWTTFQSDMGPHYEGSSATIWGIPPFPARTIVDRGGSTQICGGSASQPDTYSLVEIR